MQAYRADIDGLRAFAVVPVVLFHAGISGFSGGYVGVDIFFVISGYLITGTILSDESGGGFKLSRFYERRIRRILPALLAVLVATTIVATALLLPSDLNAAAKSVLSALGFVSNIFFWRTGGYFGGVADEKPLLHTWSLSVEEQYYIFIPIILMLTFRFGRRVQIYILAFLTLISFSAATFGMSLNKSLPVFFLLPFRAWEILLGALLAYGVVPSLTPALRSVVAMIGVVLILAPVAIYNESTPFPGLTAVPPCLGAFLIIWAGRSGKHVLSLIFENRVAVYVGLMSYSLYLWHWPIIVFTKYFLISEFNIWAQIFVLGASVVLAVFSLNYIERPFRRGGSYPVVGGGAAGLAGLLAASCGIILSSGGLPGRFPKEVSEFNSVIGTMYKCEITDYVRFADYYGCPLNLKSRDPKDADLVIWGDSHAQMYIPGIEQDLRKLGERGLLVPMNGCPPIADRNISKVCWNQNKKNFDAILRLPARRVVIGMNWGGYKDRVFVGTTGSAPGNNFEQLLEGVDEVVNSLRAGGKEVVLIGPIPTPGYPIASIKSRSMALHRENKMPTDIAYSEFRSEFSPVFSYLERRSREAGISVFYPDKRICGGLRCEYIIGGRPIFADEGHLSASFAQGYRGIVQ